MRTVCRVGPFLVLLLSQNPNHDIDTATQLARDVLDIAASHIKPGITTDEIDEIVHNETIKRDSYPSPLNYRRFPKSVCTYDVFSCFVYALRLKVAQVNQ